MIKSLLIKAICPSGLSAFCFIGVYFVSKNDVVVMTMPEWKSASDDTETTYENGIYAKNYKRYLVSTSPKSENNKWWEWSYRNKFLPLSEKVIDRFSFVTSAIEGETSLRAICKSAYESSTDNSDISPKVKSTILHSDDFLEENVWKFCSPGNGKPKAIAQTGKGLYENKTNSYGRSKVDSKELIDVNNEDNDWMWAIKEEEFFNSQIPESRSEFKKLHDSESGNLSKSTRKLKETCGRAYEYTNLYHKKTLYPENEVYQFCSLKPKETTKKQNP